MKKAKNVGGIWKKGKRLFLVLDGKPYNAYENQFKSTPRHPDYNISILEDDGESEERKD